MPDSQLPQASLVELTADITSAYVGHNSVSAGELPTLIISVFAALAGVGRSPERPVVVPLTPAVPIRKSITEDYLICLEDGGKFKSLKRHLRTQYNQSPDDYRAKWDLPSTYPMVAPAYAASRSALAKQMGLGSGGRRAKPPTPKQRTAK